MHQMDVFRISELSRSVGFYEESTSEVYTFKSF